MHQPLAEKCDRIQRALAEARSCDVAEERLSRVLDLIQRTLIEFHNDWSALCREENGDAWVTAADECFDCYSHQLYDMAWYVQDILAEDLVWHLRTLSAEMIKTVNICHMLRCEDTFRERGSRMAREARHSADLFVIRCTTVRRRVIPAR
ncbi:hypothetical protein FGU65_06530 [Methanoculleus sp. FWC-SCC1]|uniref:PhoU domain-containing protein n=1 Tax=Methanoculleus frigidifontis TaxID=2584085 RepID=A0ABT8M9F2_9EURY|nr:hypothetical protein [Methanoculleus sp. FWC-SCC1]MDN7024545.1 hypothetical protein [Methanoculleus sp. FWC-SCC1]